MFYQTTWPQFFLKVFIKQPGPSQKNLIVLFHLLTVSIKRPGLDIWKKSLLNARYYLFFSNSRSLERPGHCLISESFLIFPPQLFPESEKVEDSNLAHSFERTTKSVQSNYHKFKKSKIDITQVAFISLHNDQPWHMCMIRCTFQLTTDQYIALVTQ